VLDQVDSLGTLQVVLKIVQRDIIRRFFISPDKEMLEIILELIRYIHFVNSETICDVHSKLSPFMDLVFCIVLSDYIVRDLHNLNYVLIYSTVGLFDF
jgi:hypothetical protein